MFVDKYRPSKLKDILLDTELKKNIVQLSKGKSLPNLIFYGTAGNGKTTTARALCDQMGIETYEVNASLEGIDVIRDKLMNFGTTMSLGQKGKCIILDEADNMSKAMQQALRGTIETLQKNCTFILTANYIDRILDPIQSRCTSFDFSIDPDDSQLHSDTMTLVKKICRKEKKKFTDGDVNLLVTQYFPDIRSVINNLDTATKSGTLKLTRAQAPNTTGSNVSITVATGKILMKRPESEYWQAKILVPGTRRYERRSLRTTDKKLAMKRLNEEYVRVTGQVDKSTILTLIDTMQNELKTLQSYVKNLP
jgi:DNA polymerase III delta prime subunit